MTLSDNTATLFEQDRATNDKVLATDAAALRVYQGHDLSLQQTGSNYARLMAEANALFAQALTVLDVPQRFVEWVLSFGAEKTEIILLMLAIWIVAGMVMETTPNIVVLGPLLYPLAQKIGMDPIHFCVIMITTLGLGFITPPFGLNLFVMAGLTRTPITAIARHAVPFVMALVVVSLVIGFVPSISLFSLGR